MPEVLLKDTGFHFQKYNYNRKANCANTTNPNSPLSPALVNPLATVQSETAQSVYDCAAHNRPSTLLYYYM